MTSRVVLTVNVILVFRREHPSVLSSGHVVVDVFTTHNVANNTNELFTIILALLLLAIWSRKQSTLEYRMHIRRLSSTTFLASGKVHAFGQKFINSS
jgi:hypothetical protein